MIERMNIFNLKEKNISVNFVQLKEKSLIQSERRYIRSLL